MPCLNNSTVYNKFLHGHRFGCIYTNSQSAKQHAILSFLLCNRLLLPNTCFHLYSKHIFNVISQLVFVFVFFAWVRTVKFFLGNITKLLMKTFFFFFFYKYIKVIMRYIISASLLMSSFHCFY